MKSSAQTQDTEEDEGCLAADRSSLGRAGACPPSATEPSTPIVASAMDFCSLRSKVWRTAVRSIENRCDVSATGGRISVAAPSEGPPRAAQQGQKPDNDPESALVFRVRAARLKGAVVADGSVMGITTL